MIKENFMICMLADTETAVHRIKAEQRDWFIPGCCNFCEMCLKTWDPMKGAIGAGGNSQHCRSCTSFHRPGTDIHVHRHSLDARFSPHLLETHLLNGASWESRGSAGTPRPHKAFFPLSPGTSQSCCPCFATLHSHRAAPALPACKQWKETALVLS